MLVMAASSIIAYFVLIPNELVEFGKSQLAILAIASNIFFYYSSTEYGAAPALLVPFLHTWSLGIEEQFYIAFPIVALLTHRFLSGRFEVAVWILLAASLALCVVISRHDQQFSFFMPFTRAWELLSGSLLALYEIRRGRSQACLPSHWAAAVGLLAVLAAIHLFDKHTLHPGPLTIVPVIGSLLLLGFTHKTGLVGRLLSIPPMRYIGAISYSLYLWHYPIFAFWRLSNPDISDAEKIAAIAITVALSIVSYHWVEQPLRRRTDWPIWRISASTATIIGGISVAFVIGSGLPARLNRVVPQEAMQHEEETRSGFANFVGGEDDAKPVVYVVGDSYTTNWSVALNRFIDHTIFDVVSISYLGCSVSFEEDIVSVKVGSGPIYEKNCSSFDLYINDRKLLSRAVAVFHTSHRPFEYKVNAFRFDVLDWIRRHGASPQIYIFGNYFQLDSTRYPSCLNLMFRRSRNAAVCLENANYPSPDLEPESLPLYPTGLPFTYVDLISLSCSPTHESCPFQANGMPFMTDWNHLTASFLIEMWAEILVSKEPVLAQTGLTRFLSRNVSREAFNE